MPFVLDASVALSWYLPGQGGSYAEMSIIWISRAASTCQSQLQIVR
ncbi:MAG: hypothetical protein ACRET7_12145 [Burkholderiales bacterium]